MSAIKNVMVCAIAILTLLCTESRGVIERLQAEPQPVMFQPAAEPAPAPTGPVLNFDAAGNFVSMTPANTTNDLGCITKLEFFNNGVLVGTVTGRSAAPKGLNVTQ